VGQIIICVVASRKREAETDLGILAILTALGGDPADDASAVEVA